MGTNISMITYNAVRGIKQPCFMCENRHEGCHGKCSLYADYKKKVEEVKAQVQEKYKVEAILDDIDIKSRQRILKRKGRKT